MTPIVQNAILGSDLDGRNYSLLNVKELVPVPPTLATSDDVRLTDAREPLPGSVTNASVAAAAGIVQSKLSLNGQIPTAWLGATATTAAPGSLAEYLVNKNQPNGYCGLDATGKVAAAQLPSTVGTGTVTSVGLTMPATFTVAGSPVTAAGTLSVSWAAVSDGSWFGNKSGASAAPQFYTTAIPASIIPALDAAVVTTGVIDPARLPLAGGLGVSHAPGAVPDTGDGTGGALATDYLARNMTWKPKPTVGVAYQPTLPTPVISSSGNITGAQTVSVASTVPGSIIFYSTVSSSTGFVEFPSDIGYVSLPAATTIYVYFAHAGYNNSVMASYTNPNP